MIQLSSIFARSTHLTRREMLSYIDNRLSTDELRRVELHLVDCSFCSDAVDGLKMLAVTDINTILHETDEAIQKKVRPRKDSVVLLFRGITIAAVLLALITISFLINFYFHKENSQIVNNTKPFEDTSRQSKVYQVPEESKYESSEEIKVTDVPPPPPVSETIKSNSSDYSKEKNIDHTPDLHVPTESSDAAIETESGEPDSNPANVTTSRQEDVQVAPMSAAGESSKTKSVSSTSEEGMKYLQLKDYTKALKVFEKQYKADKNNLEAAYYSGICKLNLKEYDKAIYYFDAVLLNPYHAFYTKAEWQKSVTLIAKGDKATAQILLNKIISDGKEFKDSAKQKLLQLK